MNPDGVRQGIACEESTGAYVVILSHTVIGRFDSYSRALRALEGGHGSELAVAEEVGA